MKVAMAGVRVLLTCAVVVYVLVIFLAIYSDRVIFQPHVAGYSTASLERVPNSKALMIPSKTGRVAAVYLPNHEARYTLLYSHGNGEDIGDDLPILEEFREAGFAVLAYDYSGYGQSEGKPSEAAVYANVEAAYDYLVGTLHVPSDRVIAFGHSLGAAAAIHLAGSRLVAGLIAQAPFTSAFRVLTKAQIVPWDKFNNARAIRQVHCPVLVIHGRHDEVIAFWHGETIYKLANEPKQRVWLERAGHNDTMLLESRAVILAIQEFAKRI